MSTTDTFTNYNFSFNNQETNGTMNMASFTLVSRGGMSDAMAFALTEAFNGLPWPAGTTASATVSKEVITDTSYTTDTTSTPPSFT